MALTAGFFYLFAALSVAAAVMVIVAKNPVHAVLFLILAFFNAAGLFVLLGAEFLAMILVIVYVGAVAVLFLFVVMMLDVDFTELRAGFIKNSPIGLIVGGIVLAELILLFVGRGFGVGVAQHPGAAMAELGREASNTQQLGLRTLYALRLFLRGRRPHPACRHGRCHRADAATQGWRAAPVDCGAGGAHPGNRRRDRQGAVRRLYDPCQRGARLMRRAGAA